MSFLKKIFGGGPTLDADTLVQSTDPKQVAQIDLLMHFSEPRQLHDLGVQQRWSRALPQPYTETIKLFTKLGWLETSPQGQYQVASSLRPQVQAYRERLEREKAEIMPQVRAALERKETSEALTLRREYEARFPLGESGWTGPDPQLSHSSLTRRIFFLDHWILEGLSKATQDWLKLYAAEQHLWGATWHVPESEIPEAVRAELTRPDMSAGEAAYWKAQEMMLYVDNQETWQRCKGGDHVRRIEIAGPDDEYTCETCRPFLGKEYLVVRVPELPHRGCTSPRGCRCRYEPVIEMIEDVEA
ncbi:MAG: hypothetical protein IT328_20495 [Caldilineaceae bacterium]|nr:hypothetical protein [Caldilineaceae bacterium]